MIGTNKKDAQETVDGLIEDAKAERIPSPSWPPTGPRSSSCWPSAPRTWSAFEGWEAIDRAERGRGEPPGRPRVKFVRVGEMLEAARAAEPVSG